MAKKTKFHRLWLYLVCPQSSDLTLYRIITLLHYYRTITSSLRSYIHSPKNYQEQRKSQIYGVLPSVRGLFLIDKNEAPLLNGANQGRAVIFVIESR